MIVPLAIRRLDHAPHHPGHATTPRKHFSSTPLRRAGRKARMVDLATDATRERHRLCGPSAARRGHRELEAVGDVAGPAAARVGGGGGGDADELHPRPAQEHGQGAGVVGVAPKIGVEMDPHLTTTPSVTPYSPRYPTFAALARRAVPAQQFARDAHWTDGGPRGLRRGHPVSVVARSHPRCRAHSEAAYRLGSDRGSPNHGSTLLSKRVKAQIRSPVRVRTNRPDPWRMPLEARR